MKTFRRYGGDGGGRQDAGYDRPSRRVAAATVNEEPEQWRAHGKPGEEARRHHSAGAGRGRRSIPLAPPAWPPRSRPLLCHPQARLPATPATLLRAARPPVRAPPPPQPPSAVPAPPGLAKSQPEPRDHDAGGDAGHPDHESQASPSPPASCPSRSPSDGNVTVPPREPCAVPELTIAVRGGSVVVRSDNGILICPRHHTAVHEGAFRHHRRAERHPDLPPT